MDKQYKTRVWFREGDNYSRQFYLDDPHFIPRVGEFVEGDSACGHVVHVQYTTTLDKFLVVTVILGQKDE